jgi:hypothetical protein
MLDELGVDWVQPEDLPGLRGGDKVCASPLMILATSALMY